LPSAITARGPCRCLPVGGQPAAEVAALLREGKAGRETNGVEVRAGRGRRPRRGGCDGGEADGPFRASDRGIGGTLASPWREGKSRVAAWTGEIHRRGERQDAHNGQAVSTDGSPREADPLPDCATQSHMTRRLSVNTPHAR
jgi:hypothetical protein